MSGFSVLIFSDDPEFAPVIMARWQAERTVPAFLLMNSVIWNESLAGGFDVAILGAVRTDIRPIAKALHASMCPVIYAGSDTSEAQRVRCGCPHAIILRRHEGWGDVTVLLASEMLRRLEAVSRARRAEQMVSATKSYVAVGRYMREMRHGLNNALTSVLGNAELLLLEPGTLSGAQRDQVSTIMSMAVRVHQVLKRVSAIESEMRATPESHCEIVATAQPASCD